MKVVIRKFTDYYRKNELLDNDTIEKMEYTIESFFNEFSKFLIFSLIFILLNKFTYFIFCYIAFVTLRVFSGGIHCSNYLNCFIISLLSFFIFIYFPEIINFNSNILINITVLSVLFPILFSPILPRIRKIKNSKVKLTLKILSVISTLTWIVLCKYLIDIKYINSILLAILIENTQLVFPVMKDYLRERRVKYEKNT